MKNGHIYVYNPGAGADDPSEVNVFLNINIQSIWSFPISFLIKRLLADFPILD